METCVTRERLAQMMPVVMEWLEMVADEGALTVELCGTVREVDPTPEGWRQFTTRNAEGQEEHTIVFRLRGGARSIGLDGTSVPAIIRNPAWEERCPPDDAPEQEGAMVV